MISISFRYRAACKLSYLLPYKCGYILIYVTDSCYSNMRRYFDLFGIRYYEMIDHVREKSPVTKFNKIKRVGTLHDHVFSYKKLNNRLYCDQSTLNSKNNYNYCCSVSTTKADLKDTIQFYLGRI